MRKLLLCAAFSGLLAVAAEAPVRSFTSHHEARFNGQAVSYTALAEDTILRNEKGEPAAAIFSFTYLRDTQDAPHRPVVFIFNGGPGSSSVWLHMSGLGPKRVVFGDGPALGRAAPPFAIADSEFSILDAADLVFIDPVGTGLSHLEPAGRPQDYFGFNEDARSIAEFMRLWLTRHGRWNSPRYIMGESYGSQRAAALVRELTQGSTAMGLNGVVLLGQAMDITQTNPDPDNDMAGVLYLPSMAATAWYHGKVDKRGRTFEELLAEARRFAVKEYAAALIAGNTLPDAERAPIARELATLTGIAEAVWLRHNLRLTRLEFAAQLLEDKGAVIGLYDGRFVEPRGGPAGEDPAMSAIGPAILSAFTAYLHGDLGVATDAQYVLTAPLFARWNWDTGAPGTARFYFDVAPLVADGMRANPQLRLLVCNGYYDLTTPFFSAEHTISHSGIPRDRVEMTYYPSGHMPYVGDQSAARFSRDVRAFVTAKP